MRMMRGDFNARELAAHATTAIAPVKLATAKSYIKALSYAGYLRLVDPAHSVAANGGKCLSRYQLRPDRDSGPRAPMICRTKAVYDPNLGKIVAVEPVSEEDAIYV
jgi:hypothetical protein